MSETTETPAPDDADRALAERVNRARNEINVYPTRRGPDAQAIADRYNELKRGHGFTEASDMAFAEWLAARLAEHRAADRARVAELEAAIKAHRSQKADDRCVEDDDRLYAALGDGIKCDRRVGDKAAMLLNCARFIDRRCTGGGWPTYAELEAERDDLILRYNRALADYHGAGGDLAECQRRARSLEQEAGQVRAIVDDLRRKLAIAGVEGSPPPWEATIPRLERERDEARAALAAMTAERDALIESRIAYHPAARRAGFDLPARWEAASAVRLDGSPHLSQRTNYYDSREQAVAEIRRNAGLDAPAPGGETNDPPGA